MPRTVTIATSASMHLRAKKIMCGSISVDHLDGHHSLVEVVLHQTIEKHTSRRATPMRCTVLGFFATRPHVLKNKYRIARTYV
jgi:hypothetical protein